MTESTVMGKPKVRVVKVPAFRGHGISVGDVLEVVSVKKGTKPRRGKFQGDKPAQICVIAPSGREVTLLVDEVELV